MKRTFAKSKIKKLESPCPLCGVEIETVWMKDGSARAVKESKVIAIFTNQAHADGREMLVWIPHHDCSPKGADDER